MFTLTSSLCSFQSARPNIGDLDFPHNMVVVVKGGIRHPHHHVVGKVQVPDVWQRRLE